MTTRVAVLAVVGALLAAGPAGAADWGRGTFAGRAKPLPFSSYKRPHTKVVLVAKGRQVRLKSLKLSFHCSTDEGLPERLPVRVSSKFVHVDEGPAGGGAIVKLRQKVRHDGRTYGIDGEVFLGLRMTKIRGTVDPYLMDRRGSAVCSDSAIFTARRR